QALIAGGYLPPDRADAVDTDLALRLMRHAIRWYAVPGERRFGEGRGERRRAGRERPDGDAQIDLRDQINQFTLPPASILIRRMHAMVAVVLHTLRASADWGGIAAEYLHGEPPATPLGEAEAAFLSQRGR